MLPFKMNSISIDKKIQFVTRRAYLHTDSKRFFTDSNDWGRSVYEWIYAYKQHTREQMFLLKRTQLPNV